LGVYTSDKKVVSVFVRFRAPLHRLPKAAERMCNIFLILERDVRNQAGIADFLNFWDKNAEIQYSVRRNNGAYYDVHKSRTQFQ
jgi:hypothetical protein